SDEQTTDSGVPEGDVGQPTAEPRVDAWLGTESGTTSVQPESDNGGLPQSDEKPAVSKEEITPKDVHAAAKSAGVDYESPEFMAKSKELTGHEHLDDMTRQQLKQMVDYIAPKKPYAIAKR